MKSYSEFVLEKLENVIKTQEACIEKVAKLIYETHKNGRKFFITGSGHSHMMAEEIYARAGGYVFVYPIIPPELMLHQHPMKSTKLERMSGYAEVLLDLHQVGEGDLLFIVSNSGRNALPIEMALEAKERKAQVVAMVSMEHTQGVDSRHASGKKLIEIADIIIDNGGSFGDAAFDVLDSGYRTGATSTILGSFIMQAITVKVVEQFILAKEEVPIFRSSNLDGSDEHNQVYMELMMKNG